MKRIYVLLVALVLAALTASAGGRGVPNAQAFTLHSVNLRKTKLGKILVNTSGYTLFEFSKDTPKKDTCITLAGCPANWIPQEETAKPTAGPGVRSSLLSTINAGGLQQLTYAGHPLYIDAGSTGPGQTSYVGTKEFGGTWDAINAKGHAVR